MKAADLQHVKHICRFLESYFKGAYGVFSISGNSTIKKKEIEKDNLCFSFDLKGELPLYSCTDTKNKGIFEPINILDHPDCSSLMKQFFEKEYNRTIGYLSLDWSYGSTQKSDSISVTVCLKFA